MSESRRNVLVGMFVVFGLSAFAILVILFGKVPGFVTAGRNYTIDIHFDAVSGVRPGTMVSMSGKTIGRVEAVEFVDPERIDRGVRIVASIENRYRLPRGVRAETSEAILGMGRPPIQLVVDTPTSEYHPTGAPIAGRTASAMEAIFPASVATTLQQTAGQIGTAAEALTPVLRDLHGVLEPRDLGEVDRGSREGNLATSAVRLDATLKHFNELLGDPAVKGNLKEAIANFHRISTDGKAAAESLRGFSEDARGVAGDVKALVAKAGTSIDRIDQNVDRVALNVVENLDTLSRVLDGLAAAAAQIRNGEGTLGKLAMDDRLFEAMVLTFQRLAEAGDEFKVLAQEWQKGRIRVGF